MKKNKIFIIVFIVFTICAFLWSFSDENYTEPKKEVKETVKKNDKEVKSSKIFVDVKGEVNAPGVYELTSDNNVADAIGAAGGLTGNSDTSNINLSKKLTDEMVIIVYSSEDIRLMKEEKRTICPKVNCACITKEDEKAVLDSSEDTKEDNDGLVNINTASKDDFLSLKGIGEGKANSIIEYRNKNGNFEKIEDIKNVSGIGDSLFEKIKDYITV